MATAVTSRTVVSYSAFPPLPLKTVAVYFCCTGLGVTSTGRYPASCPVKPGLSSPAVFRHLQPRSFVLLNRFLIMPSFVRKCKGISPQFIFQAISYSSGQSQTHQGEPSIQWQVWLPSTPYLRIQVQGLAECLRWLPERLPSVYMPS